MNDRDAADLERWRWRLALAPGLALDPKAERSVRALADRLEAAGERQAAATLRRALAV